MEKGYEKIELKQTGFKEFDREVKDEKGNLLYTEHIKEPIYEEEKTYIEYTEQEILEQLRHEREIQCFNVINRGQLWYNTLTEEQLVELNEWYQAWLNVTETRVIPEKPIWLV